MSVTPLFLPAHRLERLPGALASGADAIILDLEDGVPREAKARVCDAVARLSRHALPILVRINAGGTPWHDSDAAMVRAHRHIAGVMLPKCEQPIEAGRFGNLPVWGLIETAAGIGNARTIAASPGIARLAFGSVDYCADVGCAHMRESLAHARSELVLASRIGAIAAPVDGVHLELADDAGVEAEARHASDLGFGGKLAIHPRQVRPIVRGFAPTRAQVIWAERIIAGGAGGAVAIDGRMVDEPVRAMAAAVLRRADAADPGDR